MIEDDSHQARCWYCGAPMLNDSSNICVKCATKVMIAPSGSLAATDVKIPPSSLPVTTSLVPNESGPSHSDGNEQLGLARYQNLVEIDRAEDGQIFQAVHPGLEKYVLIYVLKFNEAADTPVKHEFLRRAEAISRINHPNVIATLEAGFDPQSTYIVQEQLNGKPISGFYPRSSAERWREGLFPNDELKRLIYGAALGLRAIHEQSIIHGSLGPDSIVLDQNDISRIGGLIQFTGISHCGAAAPNQFENGVRNDINQMGALFFEIMTGSQYSRQEHGNSIEEISREMKKINPGIQRTICQVTAGCLTDNNHNYHNCSQLVGAMEKSMEWTVSRAPWRHRILTMLIEMLVASLVVGIFTIPLFNSSSPNQFESMPAALGIGFLFMIFCATIMETFLGSTLVRWCFGLRLVDHSGDPAPWLSRLCRSSLRFCAFFLVFVASATIVWLLVKMEVDQSFVILLLVPILASLPFLVLFLPSFWISSRWTFYDLLAGVTWGELNLSNKGKLERAPPETFNRGIQDSTPIGQVDQFKIYRTLGEGGMGTVFLAHDQTLHRNIALKVLAAHLIDNTETRRRFRREARLAAKVTHPNLAQIYGDGIWDNSPYIAMELVEGKDLQKIVQEKGPIRLNDAWNYIIQTADGLQAAAQLGVIHRDVKPANLMLTQNGRIKIMDFGISRQIESDVEMTRDSAVLGTPMYMSPEQAMGNAVDFRSDIYSLGLTLYFLLAGRPAFSGKNHLEILAKKIDSEPTHLLGIVEDLTSDQQAVVNKMIAKEPENRYLDYKTLLADLRHFYAGDRQFGQPLNRFAAEVLNVFGICMLSSIAVSIFLPLLDRHKPNLEPIFIVMILAVVLFASMYLWGIATKGTTLGMKSLGLQVIRTNGRPVGFWRSLVRFLVAYPYLPVFPITMFAAFLTLPDWPQTLLYLSVKILFYLNVVTIIISSVLLFRHPRRQTLHDLAADTIVIQQKVRSRKKQRV